MNRIFTVTVPRDYVFTEGFGVVVTPIFEEDTGMYGERISDIDVEVVAIREADVKIIGGVPCLPIPGWAHYVPVENFEEVPDLTEDDTHDLRSRWFETEDEANEHAEYTRNRWANPQAWESFVKL